MLDAALLPPVNENNFLWFTAVECEVVLPLALVLVEFKVIQVTVLNYACLAVHHLFRSVTVHFVDYHCTVPHFNSMTTSLRQVAGEVKRGYICGYIIISVTAESAWPLLAFVEGGGGLPTEARHSHPCRPPPTHSNIKYPAYRIFARRLFPCKFSHLLVLRSCLKRTVD